MKRRTIALIAGLTSATLLAADFQVPIIAAGGLLHPARRTTIPAPPVGCVEEDFAGEGVTLRGWSCSAHDAQRGTLVYLHGIADNRGSGVGAINRYTRQGLDVIAYDSRAHGRSDGNVCAYGVLEKLDLRRVLNRAREGPVVLLGTSLGAAVALQAAPDDNRISAIVAAEVFADLTSVARERAPWFLPQRTIRKALEIAEAQGSFRMDNASPVSAAKRIHVPVLLIHGSADTETAPSNSARVLDSLAGPKRLIMVEGAGHNRSLADAAVWRDVDSWLTDALRERR